jgi:sugar O-acyltransferase (sialic acid O-acetyltransferase NeuD family)
MADAALQPPCAITVPREGASDDEVVLVERLLPQGAAVSEGQVLCVFESSKTAFEVAAPCDGFVHWTRQPGDRVPVGEPCGWVLASALNDTDLPDGPGLQHAGSPEAAVPSSAGAPSTPAAAAVMQAAGGQASVRLSKAAHALCLQQGFDPSALRMTGLVTAADAQAGIDIARGAGMPRGAPAPGAGHQVVIVGGGGHAKMFIDILQAQSALRIAGIVDPGLAPGSTVLGVPVLGDDGLLPALWARGVRQAVLGVGAVGNHRLRSRLFQQLLALGFALPNIVHSRAVVEPSARLGQGNLVMAQAYVGSAVRIGDNCIINTGSIVSHDCVLHDNVHLAPGAVLAGGVEVGTDTLIGMNCAVYMRLRIGRRVTVANQSSVLADLPDDSLFRS